MKTVFELKDLDSLVKKYILPKIGKYRIFLLKGPLGAGKTTLIKRILAILGVSEQVTSPTFNYINIYKSKTDKELYHFDLYRLDSLDSFLSLGFDEYLNKEKGCCFIEWPEVIDELMKDIKFKEIVCNIEIKFNRPDIEKRIVTIE